jgi:hypothetical protein
MNRRSDESRDCASHCTPASAHGRALPLTVQLELSIDCQVRSLTTLQQHSNPSTPAMSVFRNLVHRTTCETELRPGFDSSGPGDELLHAPGPYFLCGMLMIVKVFN